ncbi:MAG: hypothetical protein M0009_01575 [Deltaproteobacteria bacterium]|nr:hypothetical protein [Deltaproteobacteria bacterium]
MSKFLILSGALVSILAALIALIKLAVLPGPATAALVAVLFVLYTYVLTRMDGETKKRPCP